jgi:acid stress-induced BolA-like protein IbaG/YrbA
MSISHDNLKAILEKAHPEVVFTISGNDRHIGIKAVGDIFEGLSTLKRQQLMHQTLKPLIQSGEVHAVNLTLKTPSELG